MAVDRGLGILWGEFWVCSNSEDMGVGDRHGCVISLGSIIKRGGHPGLGT